MIWVYLALVLIVAAFAATIKALVTRVLMLERKLALLEVRPVLPSLPVVEEPPLQGLRIGIDIAEDLKSPQFSRLLEEQFTKQDVLECLFGSPGDVDLVVSGSLVCNGYSDVYYQANIKVSGLVSFELSLKPPHGDRPLNLAIELVARISSELGRSRVVDERRRALGELRSP